MQYLCPAVGKMFPVVTSEVPEAAGVAKRSVSMVGSEAGLCIFVKERRLSLVSLKGFLLQVGFSGDWTFLI